MTNEASQVYFHPGDDPEMDQACTRARASFRYFWRELTWERRRIVGALDVAAVKIEFADEPTVEMRTPPQSEHMWVSNVDFDGYFVSGTLMNQPNWVRSVAAGDLVRVPLGQIDDWMYSRLGRAYGGFTINLMRSRMEAEELHGHDTAWGLEFGDPLDVQVMPDFAAENQPEARRKGWFGLNGRFGAKKARAAKAPIDLEAEHPMALNMVPAYTSQVVSDPSVVHYRDERGWTQLHHFALGGSVVCTQFFLDHGADPKALTASGLSAAQLAHSLGWTDVVALLQRHGG